MQPTRARAAGSHTRGFTGIAAALALALSCSRTGLEQPLPAELCVERCSDGRFCNGRERCDADSNACLPGPPEDCDDGDECTIDSCDATADACAHRPQPRDDDGDGWDACDGDCDDRMARAFPGASETCDMVDEDCDGSVDEGLRSECGDCRLGCQLRTLPTIGPWEPTEDNAEGVEADGDGALVLSSSSRQRFDAWIANARDGLVTKLDTRDGRQLGQYHSVLSGPDNDALSPSAVCENNKGGNCPSRTAVDLLGAVYIANRAFEAQGTVTKIAGFEDDCIDRDGDGVIRTSRDVSGNGMIDLDEPGEFHGQDDECLLWTVNVGGLGSVPRALAVTADGHIWVGLFGESRVVELDPADGRELSSIPVPGFAPYGAAIDGAGKLWLTEPLTGKILSIDTTTKRPGSAKAAPSPEGGCPNSYGIVVDASGVVWIAGFTCPYAFGYDPASNSWRSVHLPDGGVTRGIAADDRGRIYVAASHDLLRIGANQSGDFLEARPTNGLSRLTVFDGADGGNLRTFGTNAEPIPGQSAIGVGLDHQRRAWLVNRYSGTATLVDPDSGQVTEYAVGSSPYTYSDFTGFSLRRLFARNGQVREQIEGCPQGPSEWEQVSWDADLPAGSRIEIRLRTADSAAELARAPWLGPWSAQPVDLLAAPGPLGEGRLLETEVRLVSGSSGGTPTLRQLTFQLHCPL